MGAGQVLGARLGAQSARGACVGRTGGSWAQQALGAGRAAGARGPQQARGRQARGGARGRARQQARARAERARQGWLGGRRAAWALGMRPGRAGWPWAVHSVHSAYFWPGSTRYFPESKFFGHCS